MLKKTKIDFSKLIGNKYSIEVKMFLLDWMLKTGKDFDHQYGWNRDGINKSLFAYSANSHDLEYGLPDIHKLDWHFDAIFARAVYSPKNKSLTSWRKTENIFPDKYRMLEIPTFKPQCEQPFLSWLISDIKNLEGSILNKNYHHKGYKERTLPKIIDISIFTIGNGWTVKYVFSFKEFDYEPGWTKAFNQKKGESIWQFLIRAYEEINKVLIKSVQ